MPKEGEASTNIDGRGEDGGAALPPWLAALTKVFPIFANEARVNGVVSEIMEDDTTLIVVVVMSVLDNILPSCSRVGEGEALRPRRGTACDGCESVTAYGKPSLCVSYQAAC